MKDAKKDFESFAEEAGSQAGSSFVLQKINAELDATAPACNLVIAKMAGIHLISSLVTLMACPQFGVRLFFEGDGLMHYFMQISPTFCFSFCGALYLSVTFLIARFTLNVDEWLMIMRSRTLTIGALALLSLGTFFMITRDITLESAVFWLFGATLGAEAASASKNFVLGLFRRKA